MKWFLAVMYRELSSICGKVLCVPDLIVSDAHIPYC
jgi:hypothetical protein